MRAARKTAVWFLIPILILALVSCAPSAPPLRSGCAEIHFIDVEQGDAILIRADGANVLIDAGSNQSEEELRNYLVGYGVETIEYAVFTHPHEDHIGGADMILRDFDVANVIIPDCASTSSAYERMLDAIEACDAAVYRAEMGDVYFAGDVRLEIIGPVAPEDGDANNSSVVILATYGETRAILSGDAESESESEMIKLMGADKFSCDVLKVGHHGSDTSSSEEWLQATSPSFAVISCGKNNPYGHPHTDTVKKLEEMGCTVFRTDVSGNVILESDGKVFRTAKNKNSVFS